MNRADLKKIKAEYLSGGITLQELADKYGIPYSTLTKTCSKEKWKEKRKENGKKTERKIAELIAERDAKRVVTIVSVADKLLDKISEMLEQDVSNYNTQNIKNLTSALKDIKEIKGEKSDADMREQEARIKNLEKQAEKEADTVNEIEIVFNAGPEEWNE